MGLQENIAATIRAVMERKHRSLTEFSEELGISRTALYDYLKARGNPSAATIEHIAEKLEISPAALMTGLMELDHKEIALLLLDTIQSVAELPEGEAGPLCGAVPGNGGAMERGVTEPGLSELRFRKAMPVTATVVYRTRAAFPLCPQCGSAMEREYQSFCDRCGQKLDWRQYTRSRTVTRL